MCVYLCVRAGALVLGRHLELEATRAAVLPHSKNTVTRQQLFCCVWLSLLCFRDLYLRSCALFIGIDIALQQHWSLHEKPVKKNKFGEVQRPIGAIECLCLQPSRLACPDVLLCKQHDLATWPVVSVWPATQNTARHNPSAAVAPRKHLRLSLHRPAGARTQTPLAAHRKRHEPQCMGAVQRDSSGASRR